MRRRGRRKERKDCGGEEWELNKQKGDEGEYGAEEKDRRDGEEKGGKGERKKKGL